MRPLPAQIYDGDSYGGRFIEPTDDEGQAIRDVQAAIDKLFDILSPADAHYYATKAIVDADRDFRRRSQANGNT